MLELPPGGKVAALNEAVAEADGEILAFSDANTEWAPDALGRLLAPFADERVGYVCGQVRFLDPDGDNLEGAYWRYEMAIRAMESELAGVTAGNGAIYAVRRSAYEELPRVGQPRPQLPLPPRQARPALALRAGGAGRGEDGADDRGRVRPQTADDGRPLGHRRRRRNADPARLPAALRLRALLPPAAPLRDAVPPPPRLHRNLVLLGSGWFYYLTLIAQLALLGIAALSARLPDDAVVRICRYYVLTQASIVLGLWDRLRHGPGGRWEKAAGTR